ncbi:hypothetical protein RSSM_03230 [Rhodopirellula sallentina SM41]|uniref:Uncharacterized protein n=1 Tax=Rhodopirellula sallentina SM41 TaxID=1263870 RepID=M5U230_9BACT|nr:hypothetical protein RSSM_03230 [Rhodopirellula sallentina SM41]
MLEQEPLDKIVIDQRMVVAVAPSMIQPTERDGPVSKIPISERLNVYDQRSPLDGIVRERAH